jgi:formylglycine-generating enzyme required for sulfatase activity
MVKRYVLTAVVLLVLLISGLASSFAGSAHPAQGSPPAPLRQPGGGLTLTGQVTGESGLPLAGAAVYLLHSPRVFLPILSLHAASAGSAALSPLSPPAPPLSPQAALPGAVYTATTNASGYYTFTNLAAGSYTLVPAKASYTFTPAARFIPLSASTSLPPILAALTEMVLVPAGAFQMGCAPADATCAADEGPLHNVFVDGFEIDTFEVTNARYAACVRAGACTPPHRFSSATRSAYFNNPAYDSYPVIEVDWGQAGAFCAWDGKRLPAEAEWEKAARGASELRIYPWGDEQADCTLANIGTPTAGEYCAGDTTPAGSYPSGAGPYGAQDLSGSVLEWVSDWYQGGYYASQSCWSAAPGPDAGTERVARGGSWYYYWGFDRSSSRFHFAPDFFSNSVGFRCARSYTPPNQPPTTPADPSPAPDASGLLLDALLSWSGGDPDDDLVTYTLYLEAGQNPPTVVVSDTLTGTSYNPGPLSPNTHYYWQVVARDEHGASTPGPAWGFLTGGGSFDPDEMVTIPAGDFQMGCSPMDVSCTPQEQPLHTVYLSAFAIDRYEVTNARYKACIDGGGCTPPQDPNSFTRYPYFGDPAYNDYPVIFVDWDQAAAFCAWDGGKRLPTEAEWEKAARGSATRIYPWGDAWDDQRANYCHEIGYPPIPCMQDTSAVNSHSSGASPYGVLNMSGNVMELVNDWYQADFYHSPPPWINPTGPVTGTLRAARGGGWQTQMDSLSVSTRFSPAPTYSDDDLGFRCARSSSPPNHPPAAPSAPVPAHDAAARPPETLLQWTGGDPDGDRVTYDVLFAAGDTPLLVSKDQPGLSYRPRTLSAATRYSWQVIARDEHGASTPGPLWSFTTAAWTLNPYEMVSIPAGSFQMGCSPADSACSSAERPLHSVTLGAYQIDRYEVTNARYQACVAAGECSPPHRLTSATRASYFADPAYAAYPVIHVDWSQAGAFCTWEGKRLPTEAEWEKAARGASSTRIYPWGDVQADCTLANIRGAAGVACLHDTAPIGSYHASPSPYGVMDLSGNALEWVFDWYQAGYYASQAAWDSPSGPPSGPGRLLLGGSFETPWSSSRLSARYDLQPQISGPSTGFRCAVSDQPLNLSPLAPADPTPGDGGVNFPLTPQLSWVSSDPDGDPLTYTVFLEAGDNPPTAVVTGTLVEQFFRPGVLLTATLYSWQVVARDAHGASTPGPVWRFTTGPGVTEPSAMLSIPAGDFWMGCSPLDKYCQAPEKPLHQVYVCAFDIDQYEVTQSRYQACVDAGGCTAPQLTASGSPTSTASDLAVDNSPVRSVTWSQAGAFCAWEGKRLPTEAEWEMAARGTNSTRIYPWGNAGANCSLANGALGPNWKWMIYCNPIGPKEVGAYPFGASRFGLLDMLGNVSEWVSDWYQAGAYHGQPPWLNPPGPLSGAGKVLRGGNFDTRWGDLRLSTRFSASPEGASSTTGFRCVRSH